MTELIKDRTGQVWDVGGNGELIILVIGSGTFQYIGMAETHGWCHPILHLTGVNAGKSKFFFVFNENPDLNYTWENLRVGKRIA
jgi:hypothetical protein